MYNVRRVSDDTWWLGASDRRLQLFENIYPVPEGMSYNNYLILDGKTCLMDGIDAAVTPQFLENLEHVLNGRSLDYMVVQHMEPDHCSSIPFLLQKYPQLKIVASAQALRMIQQFYPDAQLKETQAVKEGDTLNLGSHVLQFITAPMVHWPEVIMTFDQKTGVLFSADAFGAFGAMSGNIFADEVDWEKDWYDEARRYYVNIVGKYGLQTGNVLKKAAGLPIQMLCPLHAHIWRKDLSVILNHYQNWASCTPEIHSTAVFYGSIYGSTANACDILAEKLAEKGIRNVRVYDVSKTDTSELISRAWEYSTLVFASATYNAGLFDPMQHLLDDLKNHGLHDRTVGLIENGTWAPMAGNLMKKELEGMKNITVLDPVITIRSGVSEQNLTDLKHLGDQIAENL